MPFEDMPLSEALSEAIEPIIRSYQDRLCEELLKGSLSISALNHTEDLLDELRIIFLPIEPREFFGPLSSAGNEISMPLYDALVAEHKLAVEEYDDGDREEKIELMADLIAVFDRWRTKHAAKPEDAEEA